jgi:hypothetical protein
MPFVAILGAGPIGGALTYTLASRSRFDEVRLLDTTGTVAVGQALDIRQAGPADGWSTKVSGHAEADAAAGAWVLVLADLSPSDAPALLREVLPRAPGAVLVCAAASHGPLVTNLVGAGLCAPDALLGSAPAAARASATSLLALECDATASEVFVTLGSGSTPSGLVIDWERTAVRGRSAGDALPRSRRAQLTDLFARAWPPGAFALASAAARMAEAAWFGSRERQPVWLAGGRAGPRLEEVRFEPGGRLLCQARDR